MKPATLLKILSFYVRFTPSYTKPGYHARRLAWGRQKPLDFSGQRWLVTGASAGIGKAVAHEAASAGAQVLAVSRSRERLRGAAHELPEAQAARVRPLAADMSLQRGTDKLLQTLTDAGERIDVLINNVGVLMNEHTLTDEGREASFATNLLTHYQLTEGLISRGLLADDAVIVNMSSGGMYNAPLNIAGLNVTDPRRYIGKAAYASAKRAQLALTEYWNDVYGERGISAYVTHPGWVKTPGVKTAMPLFWKLQNLLLRTPRQGADTALWLCAERPAPGDSQVIWFDRRQRPAHIFEATRKPRCTVGELVEYLEGELARGATAQGDSARSASAKGASSEPQREAGSEPAHPRHTTHSRETAPEES